MIKDIKEAFEKTKIAGLIAAGALDEINKIIRPGISTDKIIIFATSILTIIRPTLPLCFTEDFQNHAALLLIMSFVMEYHLIKF